MPAEHKETTRLLLAFIDESVQGLNEENQLLVISSSALHACKSILLVSPLADWWPLKVP